MDLGEGTMKTKVFLCVLFVVALGCGFSSTLYDTPVSTPLNTMTLESVLETEESPHPSHTSTPIVFGDQDSKYPLNAVVQLTAEIKGKDGKYQKAWTGSGTIISPQGLILTNSHLITPSEDLTYDRMVVSLTFYSDQAPKPLFLAEVMEEDQVLDLAVLKLTEDLEGNPVASSQIMLPHAVLGNSDSLELGDSLVILGYPGIGGKTITLTQGVVSGFSMDEFTNKRGYIKTNAAIAGGNSGGLATNQDGEFVAIPTRLGTGRIEENQEIIDCRVIVDTNRDGKIDDKDTCIPTGGFINALRPVNLALPMIKKAAQEVGAEIVFADDEIPETMPTQSPTQIPSAVYYEDDFEDPTSGWETFTSSDLVHSYHDGKFEIDIMSPNIMSISTIPEEFEDVVIDVDVIQVEGNSPASYGLICGYQDDSNFYGFEVAGDGHYMIWKFSEDEFIVISEWAETEFLNMGATPDHISVVCSGYELTLRINGEWTTEVRDEEFSGGEVGLFAVSGESSGATVTFDDFIVKGSE